MGIITPPQFDQAQPRTAGPRWARSGPGPVPVTGAGGPEATTAPLDWIKNPD